MLVEGRGSLYDRSRLSRGSRRTPAESRLWACPVGRSSRRRSLRPRPCRR